MAKRQTKLYNDQLSLKPCQNPPCDEFLEVDSRSDYCSEECKQHHENVDLSDEDTEKLHNNVEKVLKQ